MSAVTTSPPRIHGAAHARGGDTPRVLRLLRGPETDPRWARPALIALLALTALLYMAGLSRNGWANDFYAAAVQAGSRSWKAFFFGSFDASNFITVDKTPASLWVMELSARAFGLNYWSVLVPQALEGVATAGLLYATVRRWSGPAAGIIAAGVLAITPVAVLLFRFNNPDALLLLMMTAAAYAMTRAIDSGRTRWVAFSGALLGFGFLTKMLQAFLVLPALALVYLVAGPPRLGRRIWQLLVGAAALVVGAGWWVAIVQLTPAADRPYIGGSTSNSVLQLALGYNGLGRLTGNETGSVGFSRGGGGAGSAFGGSIGLTRLFAIQMGGQISWLLPAALIALAAMLWIGRRTARTDRTRAAALLWGGWLLVTGAVFSFMAGIVHPYYTIALAPAIGALVGIGSVTLWRARDSVAARTTLAGGLALTALWAYVPARPVAGLAALAAVGDPALRVRRDSRPAGRPVAGAPGGRRTWPGRAAGAARPVRPGRGAGRPARLRCRHGRDRARRRHPDGRPGGGLVRRTRGLRRGRRRNPRRHRNWRHPNPAAPGRDPADRSRAGHRGHWRTGLPGRDRRGALRPGRYQQHTGHFTRWSRRDRGRRRPGREHPGLQRDHQAAGQRRGGLPVGSGHGRRGKRGTVPASQRQADHGDRRLQRHRPNTYARRVHSTRRRAQDPLLHRHEPGQLRRRHWRGHADHEVGHRALQVHDGGRRDDL